MAQKDGVQRGVQSECMLELGGGSACYGRLVNLSLDTALVSTQAFAMGGRRSPRAGDTGVITLQIRFRDKSETLKISCRVAYVHGGQISLSMLTSTMTKRQQELLKEITRPETG